MTTLRTWAARPRTLAVVNAPSPLAEEGYSTFSTYSGWVRGFLRKKVFALSFVAAFFSVCSSSSSVHADTVSDFYTGRTIRIMVGFGPGGGYDVYARTLARHFGGHVPGRPTVVVQNVPGAAGLALANSL